MLSVSLLAGVEVIYLATILLYFIKSRKLSFVRKMYYNAKEKTHKQKLPPVMTLSFATYTLSVSHSDTEFKSQCHSCVCTKKDVIDSSFS